MYMKQKHQKCAIKLLMRGGICRGLSQMSATLTHGPTLVIIIPVYELLIVRGCIIWHHSQKVIYRNLAVIRAPSIISTPPFLPPNSVTHTPLGYKQAWLFWKLIIRHGLEPFLSLNCASWMDFINKRVRLIQTFQRWMIEKIFTWWCTNTYQVWLTHQPTLAPIF